MELQGESDQCGTEKEHGRAAGIRQVRTGRQCAMAVLRVLVSLILRLRRLVCVIGVGVRPRGDRCEQLPGAPMAHVGDHREQRDKHDERGAGLRHGSSVVLAAGSAAADQPWLEVTAAASSSAAVCGSRPRVATRSTSASSSGSGVAWRMRSSKIARAMFNTW